MRARCRVWNSCVQKGSICKRRPSSRDISTVSCDTVAPNGSQSHIKYVILLDFRWITEFWLFLAPDKTRVIKLKTLLATWIAISLCSFLSLSLKVKTDGLLKVSIFRWRSCLRTIFVAFLSRLYMALLNETFRLPKRSSDICYAERDSHIIREDPYRKVLISFPTAWVCW